MASPLNTAKPTVSLTPSGPPGSRIRRDPVPATPPQQLDVADPQQRDARMVMIGVIAFTLAIVIITLGIASVLGWSPRDYVWTV